MSSNDSSSHTPEPPRDGCADEGLTRMDVSVRAGALTRLASPSPPPRACGVWRASQGGREGHLFFTELP